MPAVSPRVLHVTNGDAAAEILRNSGITGDILPWRDVLTDGPVPGGQTLDALSDLRADYLAARFRLQPEEVRADMAVRNATLREAIACDEVVLWFEHDLYDQLQILQILDILAAEMRCDTLSMVCIDRFPGIDPFHGLGQLSPEQMGGLWPERQPLGLRHLDLARTAWRAFTAGKPSGLNAVRAADTDDLPFLDAAMARLMAEYPSTDDGLPRTERWMLEAVAAGVDRPGALFRDHLEVEPAPYHGDWSFWWRLAFLCDGPQPLLAVDSGGRFRHPPGDDVDETFRIQRLVVTKLGAQVLAGDADALDLIPFDRWIGGVHLHPDGPDWRYDPSCGRISLRRPALPERCG